MTYLRRMAKLRAESGESTWIKQGKLFTQKCSKLVIDDMDALPHRRVSTFKSKGVAIGPNAVESNL